MANLLGIKRTNSVDGKPFHTIFLLLEIFNVFDRFDANLSEKGVKEAESGGQALKDAGYKFDIAHTSLLTRAQVTLGKVLEAIGQSDLPIEKTWRLNERHYGALTGLNKAETAEKHGEEQVKIWRRSFDVPPPAMEKDHPYYDNIVNDSRYADGPKGDEFPMCESLKLTIERTLPYWNDVIVPQVKKKKCSKKWHLHDSYHNSKSLRFSP